MFSSIPVDFSNTSAALQKSQKLEGDVVTPLPTWRHTAHSVCSFDGGTRFSATFEKGASFCHFRTGVLDALREHSQTREPVQILPGVSVRGASKDECSYFRDYPHNGAVVLVSDEWRIIIRSEFFATRLQESLQTSDNTAVVIFGWRAFAQNPSVSAAYRRLESFLAACSVQMSLDVINRLDVNITTDAVPMSLIRDAFTSGCMMSRSAGRLFDNRPGVLGTLYVGGKSSPVMMRAYDKTAELRGSLNTSEGRDKLRFLRGLFGEDSLTRLTRVEFELHRAYLRDFKVIDFDDLETKLLAMLKNLTGKWLRVLETPHDVNRADRHVERLKVVSWWQSISAKFAEFAETIQTDQRPATRDRHERTTGARSFSRALSWLKIAGLECLALRCQNLDDSERDATIEEIGRRLVVALKQTPAANNAAGWGSGADLAWKYVLDDVEM